MANFGDLVQESFVRKFRANMQLRMQQIAALKTADEARAFVAAAKARVRAAYHFPAEKSPLNPVITHRTELPDFTIEHVLFYSRPDFPVTANLYLPKKLEKPAPAILLLCGHASEGKACDTYQQAMSGFAMQGCVVLAVDPIHQGERVQLEGKDIPDLCQVHNILNRQLLAVGEDFTAWRAYDAIRGIDYLLTRPEVDPARIGVNGNSGGGTMTAVVNALEDRIAAAAPSCYVTTWLHNVENELPCDAEQIPACCAADGGEMADLLLATAPRPVLLLGQKKDFFDVRGTVESYRELKHLYTLFGYGDRVEIFCGPTNHGYTIHQRNAAYEFFGRRLGFRSFPGGEPEGVPVLPPEKTFVLTEGSTLHLDKAMTVQQYAARRAASLAASRKTLAADDLKARLRNDLQIGEIAVPHYRQLRCRLHGKENRPFSAYALETEPDMLAILKLMRSDWDGLYHLPDPKPAVIFVPHQDAESELFAAYKPDESRWFFGLDYRGVGETMPDGCDQLPGGVRDFFHGYGFDYHYDSLSRLRGESMLGGRVRDLLAAIELLWAHGYRDLTLECAGIGRTVGLLAAFLCEHPVRYQAAEPAFTYAANVNSRLAPLPQSMTVRGILEYTDLDEIEKLVRK